MNDDFDYLDMRNVQKMHIPLVALALMTAKSFPQQKETVVALIVNMLVEGGVVMDKSIRVIMK